MNVSLPEKMEKFVREKVKFGDYETASEVVREGLRLLQQRDEVWKNEVRAKIDAGIQSLLHEGHEHFCKHGPLYERALFGRLRFCMTGRLKPQTTITVLSSDPNS